MQKIFQFLWPFLILAGCATGQGHVNPFPPIKDLSNSSEITVKRDDAFMGSAQTFTLTIDNKDIYMFRSGDIISFKLDPGEHFFGVKCHGGWQMIGNYTELAQEIKPNHKYIFRIIPDMSRGCRIERSSQ
jgi:hypothetical protein